MATHRLTLSHTLIAATLAALSATTTGQVPLQTFSGGDDSWWAGFSVDGGRDVDGDGLSDVVVGSRYGNSAQVYAGVDGRLLHDLTGDPAGDFFGYAVALLGDLNSDGRSEIAVGAPANQGRVQVYDGDTGRALYAYAGGPGTDGLGYAVTGLDDVDGDGVADFAASAPIGGYLRVWSGTSGEFLYDVTQVGGFNGFGAAVASLGDIDGDGRGDMVIGTISEGYALIVSGKDGVPIATLLGDTPGDGFGRAVAGPGDLDGDGTPDIAVGAFFGKYVRVVSGADPTDTLTLSGGSSFGEAVAGAGDWNGDGLPELAVGVAQGVGEVQLFDGANGSLVLTIHGDPNLFPGFGRAVAFAGDVNGDGNSEVIVGSPFIANTTGHARIFARGDSPWTDLGQSLSSALIGSGPLTDGTATALDIYNTNSAAPVYAVLSTTIVSLPFHGGVLVPSVEVVVPLMSSLAGHARFAARWPPGLPSGTSIVIQAWSPGTGVSWRGTNALRATVP